MPDGTTGLHQSSISDTFVLNVYFILYESMK